MRLLLCVIVLLALEPVIVRANEPIPVALGAVGYAYMNTFLPALSSRLLIQDLFFLLSVLRWQMPPDAFAARVSTAV
jgi:hypothetical protein